ncbi:M48 family metallopeptidase [Spiroplasma endosymbiont of Anurida maritima]|uniref:M48 family metallopeptidase n=1 Tax=Spiroplasma endosymbiont of Anurida maritima TaxID=2967972 RepID=UPI0036D307D1
MKDNIKYFEYKDIVLKYELLYKKNQKNIILKANGDNIKISAPNHATQHDIDLLFYKNIKKILQVRDLYKKNIKLNLNKKNPYIKIYDNNHQILLFQGNERSKISNGVFYFKDYEDQEVTVKKIYNVLRNKFHNDFLNIVNKWKNIMGLELKNVSLKNMKTKWGVCYPKESKIVLNIKLVHYKINIIEYVVIHELAHLVHHNHSKLFWKLVEDYCPNFREHKMSLNEPGA